MNSTVVPPTTKRVQQHTKRELNQAIKLKTLKYVRKYKKAGYDELTERLHELNREWDTERVLEANASALLLAGSILGVTTKKRGWFFLSGIVSGFLLQHAVQGWCPPLELIRRLGVRTEAEIQTEIIAIKYLRGDFSLDNNTPLEIFKAATKDR
jgi:hypothetical protein